MHVLGSAITQLPGRMNLGVNICNCICFMQLIQRLQHFCHDSRKLENFLFAPSAVLGTPLRLGLVKLVPAVPRTSHKWVPKIAVTRPPTMTATDYSPVAEEEHEADVDGDARELHLPPPRRVRIGRRSRPRPHRRRPLRPPFERERPTRG